MRIKARTVNDIERILNCQSAPASGRKTKSKERVGDFRRDRRVRAPLFLLRSPPSFLFLICRKRSSGMLTFPRQSSLALTINVLGLHSDS